MAVVQEISARIGRTTGHGIAGNMRKHYPAWQLKIPVILLCLANTLNIGADLGAMGDAVSLLVGGPRLVYVLAFGILCAALQIYMQYARYVSVLKWLSLALFSYFGTVIVVHVPWREAAWGLFVPSFWMRC
jgi:Mn2+/Fe2+ NRAMP family transporter